MDHSLIARTINANVGTNRPNHVGSGVIYVYKPLRLLRMFHQYDG